MDAELWVLVFLFPWCCGDGADVVDRALVGVMSIHAEAVVVLFGPPNETWEGSSNRVTRGMADVLSSSSSSLLSLSPILSHLE